MNVNEHSTFDVKPNWAYGSEGCSEKNIPPNAELKYEIELLEMEKERETWDMNNKEKVEHAKTKKDQGNHFFKLGKYKIASKRYDMGLNAVKYCDDWEDAEKAAAQELQVSLEMNLAVVKSKTKEWGDVLKHAEKALTLQPSNLKALYRKALALAEMYNWSESESTFNKGLEIDPENKDFKRELAKLKRKIKIQNEKDKKMYQRMFK